MARPRKPPVEEFEDCPCTGRSLMRFVQPAILIMLARGPRHGYQLLDELAGLTGDADQKPDVGGVYRALNAMEERGLCTSQWDTSQAGPAKRRYQISARGLVCLGRWVETLDQFRASLDLLLAAGRETLAARPRG